MSGLMNPAEWVLNWLRGGDGKRVHVNGETILKSAPVWYALNRIGGHVGQMPIDCKKYLPRGSETDYKHPGYRLLRMRPNRYQTPIIFKEQLQTHALLWGNGRAAIIRQRSQPVELLPMMPDRTITMLVDGEKFHVTKPQVDDPINGLRETWQSLTEAITKDKPATDVGVVVMPDRDVLHIQGLGYDGIQGKSVIEIARESMGIGLRSQAYADRQLAKGFGGKMMLQAPVGTFRDEDKARQFLEEFERRHGNEGEAKAVGLLRDGVTANVLAMSNRDAQFVEMLKFNRQEAALWFLLESIIGDDQSVSYNSLEQKNLAYLSNCLMRWLVKWEEQCNDKLLSVSEFLNASHYFKFNVASLLRADFQTTVTTLANGITHRMWSPNEAREKLDMNPYSGGDVYENPAISPGQSSSQTTAVDARLSHLVGVECNRVNAAAKNPAKFNDWLDSFYSKWESRLTSAAVELGIDAQSVVVEMNDRKADLLELTGHCTESELCEEVEALTATWRN